MMLMLDTIIGLVMVQRRILPFPVASNMWESSICTLTPPKVRNLSCIYNVLFQSIHRIDINIFSISRHIHSLLPSTDLSYITTHPLTTALNRPIIQYHTTDDVRNIAKQLKSLNADALLWCDWQACTFSDTTSTDRFAMPLLQEINYFPKALSQLDCYYQSTTNTFINKGRYDMYDTIYHIPSLFLPINTTTMPSLTLPH